MNPTPRENVFESVDVHSFVGLLFANQAAVEALPFDGAARKKNKQELYDR